MAAVDAGTDWTQPFKRHPFGWTMGEPQSGHPTDRLQLPKFAVMAMVEDGSSVDGANMKAPDRRHSLTLYRFLDGAL